MNTKDIKSKSIDNTVQKFDVESKTWKGDMRLAVKLGYKVEPLNEEQTEYLKKLETEKAEKEAKAKVKQEAKKALLAKASELLKKKKEQILQVANDFADRVLLRAIDKEEKEKQFAETDKKVKEKVKKDRMAIAEAKRKRKAELRNKTIPSLEEIKKAKERQAFLATAHSIKREEIEARLDEKEKFVEKNKEERKAAKKALREKMAKKLLAHYQKLKKNMPKLGVSEKYAHRRKPTDRTTKEQRIEAAKAKKEAGKLAYNAEMKRQASEIAADRTGYAARQEKRQSKETERLAMIIKHKKNRLDRLFAEKLKQQKVSQINLNRFLESEKARLARKEEKRATYLTKGGIKVPKVKTIAPVDSKRAEDYTKQVEDNKEVQKVRYIIRIAFIDNAKLVADTVGSFTCKPEDLAKRMKTSHNGNMKDNSDSYVGIYAYTGIGKDMKCIREMVNDKFLEYNGESMSRVTKEEKAAA